MRRLEMRRARPRESIRSHAFIVASAARCSLPPMKDRFDEMMDIFLVPIAELGERVTDCTYFLRKDGSLAFAQGYCHPPG